MNNCSCFFPSQAFLFRRSPRSAAPSAGGFCEVPIGARSGSLWSSYKVSFSRKSGDKLPVQKVFALFLLFSSAQCGPQPLLIPIPSPGVFPPRIPLGRSELLADDPFSRILKRAWPVDPSGAYGSTPFFKGRAHHVRLEGIFPPLLPILFLSQLKERFCLPLPVPPHVSRERRD